MRPTIAQTVLTFLAYICWCAFGNHRFEGRYHATPLSCLTEESGGFAICRWCRETLDLEPEPEPVLTLDHIKETIARMKELEGDPLPLIYSSPLAKSGQAFQFNLKPLFPWMAMQSIMVVHPSDYRTVVSLSGA